MTAAARARLWKLEIIGAEPVIADAAQRLMDADPPAALAVSLLHHGAMRRIELLLDAPPDSARILAQAALSDANVEARSSPVGDDNWVEMSLKGLAPVEAGRFRLRGSHDAPARGGRIDIVIDANEAFGTGHHATTLGCLLTLDALAKHTTPKTILDVGTGTGALAIAAAHAFRRPVLASDIDPVAVRVARANAATNRIGGRVTCVCANGLNHPAIAPRRFDLAFANILAGPLVDMAAALARAISPGGRLMVSGLLERQERPVAAAYLAHGLKRERRLIIDGWATLLLRKTP